jgi:predicted Rossmann fold flavoprotein
MQNEKFDLLVVGGGAAGFFAAINAVQFNSALKVGIIEKNKEVLQKVKVSGGGRCNVTTSIFQPHLLIDNYPRGNNFLLKPFEAFGPKQTVEWFEKMGVKLKIEADGRIFPTSNNSQTIIQCFLQACEKLNIKIFTQVRIFDFNKKGPIWEIKSDGGMAFETNNLLLATGSDNRIWDFLEKMNFKIVSPLPSLFTFKINEKQLTELQGVSFEKVLVKIKETEFIQTGPFLITHWGVSGPAVLKLSAWAARELSKIAYNFKININFLPDYKKEQIVEILKRNFDSQPKKNVIANPEFGLSSRFWKYICERSGIGVFQKWAETGKKQILLLQENLNNGLYEVNGKSTFKEEFVTAGGLDLDEISPTEFRSKKYSNLYFAGEILDIDAVTGGFNFQAAWTGAWHVAKSVGTLG